MNILALAAALAFTMNLTLCLIVLSSNPKNIRHRLFACFVLSFAILNIGEVMMISNPNPFHGIFGVKVIFAGLTFAPLFFSPFLLCFSLQKTEPVDRGMEACFPLSHSSGDRGGWKWSSRGPLCIQIC